MNPNNSMRLIKSKIAVLLSVIMIIGMMPVNVFALATVTKTVVSFDTSDLETSMTVPYGTSKNSLELPSKLTANVKTATEENASDTTEESVKVNWEGTYESTNSGEYTLTAAFAEEGYTYHGKMPSVTVTVSEQQSTAQKKAAAKSADTPALLADASGDAIDLVNINAITTELFEVKLNGDDNFTPVKELPSDAEVNVGDQVHIKFQYSALNDVKASNVYFFDIPVGIDPVDNSKGDIVSGTKNIGKWWVEDGKVKMQFNEEFVSGTGQVNEGFVNFYGTINQDAVTHDGKIMLGGQVIGTLPTPPAEDLKADIHLTKVNGDGSGSDNGLVYSATKNAIQYTIKVDTNGNDTKIDTLDIKDTLSDPDDVVDTTRDYTDITISPNDGTVTFAKDENDDYVLHAENVAPDKTYTATYWVPLKKGASNASFANKVKANGTYGNHTVTASASANGTMKNKISTDKKSSAPVYNPTTGKTTVTYTVTLKADANNTTDVAGVYLKDTFTKNADWVNGITITSDNNKTADLKTETNGNKSFQYDVGTMKPGQTVTVKYEADIDSSKWVTKNSPAEDYVNNTVHAMAGTTDYSNAMASTSFKKQYTEKSGKYDTAKQKYEFTVKFDGKIPGTNSYFNNVLKTLDDKILTEGFVYSTDAPVLKAMQGNNVVKTKELTDANIGGKTEFHLTIPSDMQGAYSYELTYYVDLPDGTTAANGTVKNEVQVGTVGIVPGETNPIVFKSQGSASYGDAVSASLEKSFYVCNYDFETNPDPAQLIPGYPSNTTVNRARFRLFINNPVVAGAVIRDNVTQNPDSVFALGVPIEYVKSRMTIMAGTTMGYFGPTGGRTLTQGVDYEVEATDDGNGFFIRFLKPVEDVSSTSKMVVDYSLPVLASESGKEMAQNKAGSDTNGQDYKKFTNKARLEQPGMATDWVSADVYLGGKIKKSADTASMAAANDPTLICWLIKSEGPEKYGSNDNYSLFSGAHDITDYLPEDQEFVKATDYQNIDIPADKIEVSEDGRTIHIRNTYASAGVHVWTRIKDSVLIERGINPDKFTDVEFTNKASFNAEGVDWYVNASYKMSVDRHDKTYDYSATTENAGGVKFTLTLNKDAADLNPDGNSYTVKDVMHRALSLNKDTITVNGTPLAECDNVTLKYSEGSNNFELTVPDNEKLEIVYYAKVDAAPEESGWLSNKASIEGRLGDVSVESLKTKKIDMTAGASTSYNFYVKKKDGDDKMVSGAKFKLEEVVLKNGELTQEGTIDSRDNLDGTYKFNSVDTSYEDGSFRVYKLQETEAPLGCIKDDSSYYIAFGENIKADLKAALNAKGIQVTIGHTGQFNDIAGMFEMKNTNTDETTSVKVTKNWDDESDVEGIRPNSLKVTLKADGEEVQSRNITGNGDSWTYTFKNLPKYKTYDDTVRKEIEYTVSEEPVENYTQEAVTGDVENGFVLTNKHVVEKTEVSGTKTWVDTNPATRPESITLGAFAGSSKTPVKTMVVLKQAGNDWAYTFTDLPKYMNNTEVKYTIKEVEDINGYVAVPGKADNNFNVTNIKTNPITYAIGGTKTLTGKDITAGEFSFKLEGANVAARELTMPANAKVKADGTFAFDDVTFTKVGTYKFTVSEVNDGLTGYTYDSKPVTVTVPVTLEKDNTLKVGTVSYEKDGKDAEGISFANTYETTATELAIPVKKVIEGKDRTNGTKDFEFELSAVSATSKVAKEAPMPEETTVTINDEGTASFGKIDFKSAGTYVYQVTEKDGGAAGYTYVKEPVTVTVKVTDTDGVLSATWTTDDPESEEAVWNKTDDEAFVTFTNKYEPKATSLVLPVKKTLTGDKPSKKATFTFNLKAKGDAPMPANGKATCSVAGSGNTSFGKIAYNKAGTYTYEVTETNDKVEGYTYDKKVHKVVVTVKDNDGVLSATWTDNGKSVSNVEFKNDFDKDKVTWHDTPEPGDPGKHDPEKPHKTTPPTKTTTTTTTSKKGSHSAKTGDNRAMGSLAVLLLLSGVACEEVIRRRKHAK